MARDYCRFLTAIWDTREFRQLAEAGQRLYFLLATQEEISAVGLLPLRVRRWAEMAADTKPEAVTDTLRTLDSGKFIVVDFDTEEVLVRAFVRIDGGFTNSKRRPVIIGEWLDSCRRRPPSNVVGQVSKGVKGLLDEGIDPDDVRGGLELWASKGLHPSALPAVVNELMNSTPARPPDRPSEWQGLKAD